MKQCIKQDGYWAKFDHIRRTSRQSFQSQYQEVSFGEEVAIFDRRGST
jgi:hypothetical protein